MTTVLTTGYNVVKYPNVVQALQRLYFVNDFDAMKVSDDGTSIRTVGITAPDTVLSAPTQNAGNCDIGVHLVRYRFEDSRRQRLSEPSEALEVTVASSAKELVFTNVTSADATVDKITFEMTAAGAEAYYRVATVANAAGTTTLSTSDINLINLVPATIYGEYGHQPPPLNAIVAEHRQRLFSWGATTRTFTVGVTSASPTVTGTGFSDQWAGRKINFVGSTTDYYVSSATSTTITLTANYGGTTNASIVMTVTASTPDLLGWSRAGYPESWDVINSARRITLNSGDTPSAIASLFGDLYLIGQRSMRRLVYTSDPAAGMIVSIPNSLGAFHQRCVCVEAGGMCFGAGRDGVWMIDALLPKKISDPIDTTIASLADATRTDERFLVYEPIQRNLAYFFCLSGETSCKAAAIYSINDGKWSIWYFRQGFTAGCLNSGYTDRVRLMISDANGYSWRLGVSSNDGGGAGVITATAGSTTSVTAANSAVVGQMAYRPSTGEAKLITAATGAAITVSAYATSVAVGEQIWVGSMKQRVLTDWHVSGGLGNKKRPSYLLLEVRPNTTMGTATVTFYKDFSATPLTVTSESSATDANNQGITVGTTTITVDLDVGCADGFVAIPVPADWTRSIRAEVVAQTPYDGLRILGLRFSSQPRIDEAEVNNE